MFNTLDEWNQARTGLHVGATVDCEVARHAPYGVRVNVGVTKIPGIIECIRMHQDGLQTPVDFPPIGSVVRATVIGFRDWNQQIELALIKAR